MKTAMQELIEKFKEAQRYISAKTEYANGYDGALTDCLNLAESLIEKEKQQIIEAAKHEANFDKSPFKNAEDYYNQTFES